MYKEKYLQTDSRKMKGQEKERGLIDFFSKRRKGDRVPTQGSSSGEIFLSEKENGRMKTHAGISLLLFFDFQAKVKKEARAPKPYLKRNGVSSDSEIPKVTRQNQFQKTLFSSAANVASERWGIE